MFHAFLRTLMHALITLACALVLTGAVGIAAILMTLLLNEVLP